MSEAQKTKPIAGGIENVAGLIHHRIQAGGGPISVYEAGNPAHPDVVLLHGAMCDEARFIWDQLFPALAPDYHLWAVDMPRHGASRPWQGILDHTKLIDILDDTFNQLQLPPFSVVALSMGAGVSIEYAARHPERIKCMALFEPGGLAEKLDHQLLTWAYIKTPGLRRLITRHYLKMDDNKLRKVLERIFVGGSKPTAPERLLAILRAEIRGKDRYKENDLDDWQTSIIGPLRLKWNLLDTLPLLQCPTLWLRGSDSILVKQAEMERAVQLAGHRQKAELITIAHAGHLLPLEQPQQTNAAVKAFLDRQTGRS